MRGLDTALSAESFRSPTATSSNRGNDALNPDSASDAVALVERGATLES